MNNIIYNGNCIEIIDKIPDKFIDIVITSPFYNTARKTVSEKALRDLNQRYDFHIDDMSDEEYVQFSIKLFNKLDRVLKKNATIIYNLSYSTEKPYQMYIVLSEIMKNSNFVIADTISWKKKSAIPNNMNHNRLTRITENIFVFCRKEELKTFTANKKVKSIREKTGQKNYENLFNFIEAKNNDGTCDLNKATYSTELCDKLIDIYAKEDSLILDPFNGTGTTGVSALKLGHSYIGIELSKNQCQYTKERIKENLNIEIEIV